MMVSELHNKETLDIEQVELTDIAHGGMSVGRADDGRVVFVRGGIPGETVRAAVTDNKKRLLKAVVTEVLDPSPHRVELLWPEGAAGVTGAADFQHIDLGWQRELKACVIRTQIDRVGGPELAEQISDKDLRPREVDVGGGYTGSEEYGWHTRTRFDVIKMHTGVGMYREHSHELVPLNNMPLAVRELEDLGIFASRWDGVIAPGERMHVVAPASGPNVIVVPKRELIFTRDSIGRERDTALGPDAMSMMLEKGKEYVLHERAGDGENIYEYDVAPAGFWQVHRSAPSAVLRTVMDYAAPQPGETVLELFSGAGLLSLPIAHAIGSNGCLLSIEGSDHAVRRAGVNLQAYPWAHARQGWIDTRAVQAVLQEIKPSLVVADPPRAGLGIGVARVIAEAPSVQRIVLVSCDPAAMARDAAAIVTAHAERGEAAGSAKAAGSARSGFAVTNFSALDLFPHTHHCEVVVSMSRVGERQ